MQVHYLESGLLPEFKNAVVTIGTFDGVHLGHRMMIQQLKEEAINVDGESIIISFYPHPRNVIIGSNNDLKLLSSLDEKIALLEATGIDHLVIVPFDLHFADLTPEAYINDFLYEQFHPHTIIIGYDHRFGKNRSGNFSLLQALGNKLGFKVKEIAAHLLNEISISSTKIRKSLLNNDLKLANDLLGYPYFFEGIVVKGNQLGRTIGFPTANIEIDSTEKLIPGNGVYAVQVCLDNDASNYLLGMMNIGIRPTIQGINRVIEVNLFDFDRDIYDKKLKIIMHQYLRSEQKFDGIESLKMQLMHDQEMAKKVLATIKTIA